MKRGDRLTLTTMGCSSLTIVDHWCAQPHASRNTSRSIATISPDSSANGTKRSGAMRPRVGCCQRINASVAITRPDASSSSGWNCTTSSPWSIARHRSPSSSRRSIMCGADCGSKSSQRARPSSFATYIARSDWRSRSLGALLTADRDRDADARRHEELVIADQHRFAQDLDHALGDPDRDVGIPQVAEQQAELVATEARDDVVRPQARLQPLGDRHEQAVADVVAQRVVHELEAVDVEEQHGDLPVVRRRVEQRLLEPLEELPAVRQAG